MLTIETVNSGQSLVPVQKLCEQVLGTRVNPSTFHRWITKGCRGVRLRAVNISGWRCTTQDFVDFVNAKTAKVIEADAAGEPGASDDALRASGLL